MNTTMSISVCSTSNAMNMPNITLKLKRNHLILLIFLCIHLAFANLLLCRIIGLNILTIRYTGFLLPQPMYTATRSVDDDGHDDGDGGGTIFVPQYDRTGDSSRGSSFDVWVETEDEDDRIGIGGAGVSSIRTGGSPSLSRGSHLPPPPTTTTLFSLPPLPPPPAHTPPQPNHLSNAIHRPKKQSPCPSVPKRKRPVKIDVSLPICTRL